METTTIKEIASAGELGMLAIFASRRRMAGALANACPETSMMTIWKANVNRLKTPAYQAAAICLGAAAGAKAYARMDARKVSSTAKTKGSGITFSNRKTKKEVRRPRRDCFSCSTAGLDGSIELTAFMLVSQLSFHLRQR